MNSSMRGCWLLIGALFFLFAAPTMAQGNKPNVVFILADNVGYGEWARTAAASCGDTRRRASTSSPARGCA